MTKDQRNAQAFLKSKEPFAADGQDRCLVFNYKSTRWQYASIQVQIWPDDMTKSVLLLQKPTSRSEDGIWQRALVDIPSSAKGDLVFVGSQRLPTSQILLDDVFMMKRKCSEVYFYSPPGITVRPELLPNYNAVTTRPPFRFNHNFMITTRRPTWQANSQGGPYFYADFTSSSWERYLLSLPAYITIATTKWQRNMAFPPELGPVLSAPRGYFLYLTAGLNAQSAAANTKAYLMTSHMYYADGQDKCLTMDYMIFQSSGNLGSLGIFMSRWFLTDEVVKFNSRMEQLYKYPREGTYVYRSSPVWRRLEITIAGSRQGYLFIEGSIDKGRGVMAIDNVNISKGRCKYPNLL